MSFEQLNIHPRIVSQLKEQRITEPTPIQERAIPAALEGRDLIAIAQTGTGKTLAFGLPALTRLSKNKAAGTRMLVLTPTRELALQVASVLGPLGEPHGLNVTCVYGGVGYEPQTKALRRGAPIVIATPGRLQDHIDQKNVRFDALSVLVLDEADRMLDMGFIPAIKRILKEVPKDRQTMMFSATFPNEIARLAGDFQRDPVRIEVGAVSRPADDVRQRVYTVDQARKVELLTHVLGGPGVDSALVFIRTKHRTDRVAKVLKRDGFKVQAIHGGRSQSQRTQALNGFREGKYNVLVATDVAARGIDVQGITHVVNFDIPKTTDDYVHRIGRTARNKAKGDAVTFVAPDDIKTLRDLERDLGKKIERAEWEGTIVLADAPRQTQGNGSRRPQPSQRPSGRGGQQQRSRGRSTGAPQARNGRRSETSGERGSRSESSRSGEHRNRGESTRSGERRSRSFSPQSGNGQRAHRNGSGHPENGECNGHSRPVRGKNPEKREHARANHDGGSHHNEGDDKLRAPSILGNRTIRREPRKLGQFSRPKAKRPA